MTIFLSGSKVLRLQWCREQYQGLGYYLSKLGDRLVGKLLKGTKFKKKLSRVKETDKKIAKFKLLLLCIVQVILDFEIRNKL